MIGMIAAVAPDGLIGCAGRIPWHYPLDLKFFKETTENSIVIMGKNTWNSLPDKFRPLPHRTNLILSKTGTGLKEAFDCESVPIYPSMALALGRAKAGRNGHQVDTWIIGGGEVYRAGLAYADQIVLTLVPEPDLHPDLREDPSYCPIYFPWLSPKNWRDRLTVEHPDPRLTVARYWRKTA